MRSQLFFALTLLSSIFPLLSAEENKINLLGEDFVHRWSKGTQHEFTPSGQVDLKSWKDMLTVNHYPDSKTGEALAGVANNLLGLYKQHGGHVLRTNSIPRTEEKEAEHLIVVALPQKKFIEIVFARLVMNEAEGCSIVYSHRIYGSQAGDEASAWLKENGQKSEKELMGLNLSEAFLAINEDLEPSASGNEG